MSAAHYILFGVQVTLPPGKHKIIILDEADRYNVTLPFKMAFFIIE